MENAAQAPAHEPKVTYVPWMSTPLEAPIWKLHFLNKGMLDLNWKVALANGFFLTDPSHSEVREVIVTVVRKAASDLGYGPDDGANVYGLVNKFFLMVQWLESENTPIAAINETVAKAYATYAMDNPRRKAWMSGKPVVGPVRARRDQSAGSAVADVTHVAGERNREVEKPEDALERAAGSSVIEESTSAGSDDVEVIANRLSFSSLEQRLQPMRLMWRYRKHLTSAPATDPFPEGIAAVCEELGAERHVGEVIPLQTGCQFIYGAGIWVTELADLCLDAHEAKRATPAFYELTAIARSRVLAANMRMDLLTATQNVRATESGFAPVSLDTTVSKIVPTSCAAVILLYGIRRPETFYDLKINCVSGNEKTGWWLDAYIGKNYMQNRALPIPPVVAKAVQVLTRLSAPRRLAGNSDILCLSRARADVDTPRNFRVDSKDFDFLANIIGVDPEPGTEPPKSWHFQPKQFRRFGAAMWVYQFELPITALSAYMFHFERTTTHGYLNEPPFRSWITSDKRRLSLERIEAAAAGESGLAGLKAVSLQREKARLRSVMQVTPKDAAKVVALIQVDELGLIVQANAWGYCLAKPRQSNLKRARCMSQGIGMKAKDGRPESSASNAGTCCSCLFFISHKSRLPYMRTQLKKCDQISADSVQRAEVRRLAEQRANAIRKMIADLEKE